MLYTPSYKKTELCVVSRYLLSQTPITVSSHLNKSRQGWREELAAKSVKKESTNSMRIVRIERIHPGDAYYDFLDCTYVGSIGVLLKRKSILNADWSAGLFISIDAAINSNTKPVYFTGVNVKTIAKLTSKEKAFWNKVLKNPYYVRF